MKARKPPSAREAIAVLLVALAFGAAGKLAIDQPALEAPLFLSLSIMGLGVLLRVAAFPPTAGFFLERRDSVVVACGGIVAMTLVAWCPWQPVHSNRGVLMMGVLLTQIIASTMFRSGRAAVRNHEG